MLHIALVEDKKNGDLLVVHAPGDYLIIHVLEKQYDLKPSEAIDRFVTLQGRTDGALYPQGVMRVLPSTVLPKTG